MIPIKLSLRNFMCYRDAGINLEGVHLACLSGDNGAGKSALLDAITWAIWGKGRGSDDELVAQNEIEMAVDLEFSVGENTYKASRRRTKKGVGRTELALAIYNGSNWTNISEDSLRNTQNKIHQIVGMKYETFINSAFLLQGRADEFTVKKPSERKEVLSEILGLAYYDELEKKAKDSSKEADYSRRELNQRAEDLEKTARERPILLERLKEAQNLLEDHSQKSNQHEQIKNNLEKTKAQLEEKEKQLGLLDSKLISIGTKLQRLTDQIHDTKREIVRCGVVIARKAEIEEGYLKLENARNSENDLNTKAFRHNELTQQQNRLRNTIEREQNKLHSQSTALRTTQIQEEEKAYSLKTVLRELDNNQKELDKAIEAEETVKRHNEEVQNLREKFASLKTEGKQLEDEIKKLRIKIEQLPEIGSPCERCGTRLSKEARATTLQQYQAEVSNYEEKLKKTEQEKADITAQGNKINEKIKELEQLSKNVTKLNRKNSALEVDLENAKNSEKKVVELQSKIDEINKQLENKQYALPEQQKLEQVEKEILELAYDHQAHTYFTRLRGELDNYQIEKTRLDSALMQLPTHEKNLENYAWDQEQSQNEFAGIEKDQKQLRSELSGLDGLRRELARVTLELNDARKLERDASNLVTKIKARIEDCDYAAQQLVNVKANLEQAELDKSLYDDLATAFGKKGIQALIIDSVLPEIEDEANELLAEMSSGRMSVRFDTQRDTKKGDSTIETLDLKISDEQGMRPYEMFSGGEAFRVNFAVRLALSKLLARRNGAQLRTLFIDEGFGTQDGPGRERLIEAIHGIENKFDRVLVITHLSELKDAFPIRIEVEKTPNGSRVSIN